MTQRVHMAHRFKCVLSLVLVILMIVQVVANGNLVARVEAADGGAAENETVAGSDHKVTIFYGYGGRAGTAGLASNVFANELNNTAYDSTAKYGLTNGDFNEPSSTA